MSEANTSIEAMNALHRAIEIYNEELNRNKKIVTDAADACDLAMGNDANIQKYIQKLDSVVEELDCISVIAEDLMDSLKEEIAEISDIHDSI